MTGNQSGTNLPLHQQSGYGQSASTVIEGNLTSGKVVLDATATEQTPIASGSAPFYSQYPNVQQSGAAGQHRQGQAWLGASGPTSSHYGPIHGQDPSLQTFNMNAIAGALPDHTGAVSGQHQPHHHQQPHHGQQPYQTQRAQPHPSLMYQFQQQQPQPQYPQISGQAPPAGVQPIHTNIHYGPAFANGHNISPGAYGQFGISPTRASAMGQTPQHVAGFPQAPQYYYNPVPQPAFVPGQQLIPGYSAGNRRSSFPSQGMASPFGPDVVGIAGSTLLGASYGTGNPYGNLVAQRTALQGQDFSKKQSDTSLSSIPRGPPRKPKQSGHALWVGNLPPGTTVIELKDHFSREATKDIESLFLISKSNCAFVNYRTEATCAAAMQRFHDSRLHGVRLVCRLRRTSATPASASGPSNTQRDSSASPNPAAEGTDVEPEKEKEGETNEQSTATGVESTGPEENVRLNERYFIVKSLTLQDLELSVKNGIWATQAHNEESLNKAYEASENVYLIFSANKSGEYFGYARMTSPISKDPTEFMKSMPHPESTVESGDGPKSIPTPATEWAPKGKIIDDSARGTIFWEADLTDEEGDGPHGSMRQTLDGPTEDVEGSGSEQIWGKPFKIEWISTNRLPFYRTRGLRNPWNANREVKIARDGTELETNVGKRLVQMFHRLGPGAGPSVGNSVTGALI